MLDVHVLFGRLGFPLTPKKCNFWSNQNLRENGTPFVNFSNFGQKKNIWITI